MTTADRPAGTAAAGMRLLLLVLLGTVLSVVGAKYLLVGSALSLLHGGSSLR